MLANKGLLLVNNGPKTVNKGLLLVNNGPKTVNKGLLLVNNGPKTVDRELLLVNKRPKTRGIGNKRSEYRHKSKLVRSIPQIQVQ